MKRWRVITVVVVILLVTMVCRLAGQASPARAAGESWLTGWDQRIEITIDADKFDSTLTAFPVPIYISSASGQASDDITAIFDEVGSNSKKIAVTESDGDTELYVEIEYWDATGETALVWASSSTFSISDSSDTTLYIYYDNDHADNTTHVGDPGGRPEVWTAFTARWGMQDDPSTSDAIDSTSGGNDGVMGGSMTSGDLISGVIGKAIDFDGANDLFTIDRPAATDWYIEIWTYPIDGDSASDWWGCGGIFGREMGGVVNDWGIGYDGTNDKFVIGVGNPDTTYKSTSTYVNSWHAIVMRRSQAGHWMELYIDGVDDGGNGAITTNTLNAATSTYIGRTYPYYQGRIDEIRVYEGGTKSAAWVTAGYAAMIDDLATYGSETLPPTPTPTPSPTPPPILMGDSSSDNIPAEAKNAVATAVADYRPDSELGLDTTDWANMWALTSYGESTVEDYYWISLVGLVVDDTGDLDGWDLSDSIWAGLAIAEDTSAGSENAFTAYVEGDDPDYENMLDTAGLADAAGADEGGAGSATYYFPWAAGFKAYYGSKGVHAAGPNDPNWGGVGWKAVDWVGGATGFTEGIMPNGTFVSQSGSISYRCEDNVQAWVQIGDFLYGHLVDNSTLAVGQYHSQGSYLGALVVGTHLTPGTAGTCGYTGPVDAKCGYMCQGPTHYHLHWGFKPSGNYLSIEGWTLNLSTEQWNKGADYVGPGEYMQANWASNVIVPTPGPTITPGGPTPTPGPAYVVPAVEGGAGKPSIWDGFIAGMKRAVTKNASALAAAAGPDDTNTIDENSGRNYITLALTGFRIFIRTAYVLLRSNLDLRITIIVVTYILLLEPIRALAALYMWVKEKIPFIG